MTEIEAIYQVNVGDGETVEMSGNPDKLDIILTLMKTYGPQAWTPTGNFRLPATGIYGQSVSVLVCQFAPGDQRPTLMMAYFDFNRDQWRSDAMGKIENVTHWQPLPDFPLAANSLKP
jgi:hypothetical protein